MADQRPKTDWKAVIAIVLLFAFILYLLRRHYLAQQQAVSLPSVPATGDTGIGDNSSSNPWAWAVPGFIVNPDGTINVNISGAGSGYLADGYFPLFGFVGIDSSSLYQ